MPKITKRTVDSLHPDPSGSDRFLWDAGDGALKGFGVRVKPSGVASYIIQYRNKEGRTRRLALGRVGVLTPEEARREAADKLKEATKGGDPSAERHHARKAITIAELCDLYLEDAASRIKPSTLAMDRSRIDCHVKPLLGQLTVTELTLTHIEQFQGHVAAGKTARPRPKKGRAGRVVGGRGVASRTVGMLGTILELARRNNIISQNPARGARRFPDVKRRRFLSIDELTALGKAMREAEAEGENRTGIAATRALILTGCRKMEVLSLQWAWLDNSAQCIRFADTKSGAQLRPVGAASIRHLVAQPRRNDSKFVFPADRGAGHFVGLPRVLGRLCSRAALDDVTVHTLRHSFAAAAAELAFSELTIAGLLGHKLPGVTARYAHVPDSALVIAADRVAARLAEALDNEGPLA
ncbi:MAG: site-specific integrase [Alphaproteobacteria bacterium]|nr:site-specific integrase [Alphaproteobacteria bacterium]